MARAARAGLTIGVLALLLTGALVPGGSGGPGGGVAAMVPSSLGFAVGGPGCGNGTDPCVVTFTETGLPGGTQWSVAVTGAGTNSSTTTQVVFDLVNGTWSYVASSANLQYTPPSPGSVAVSGGDEQLNLPFVLPTYPVTFSETNFPLNQGYTWTVTLGASHESSSTQSSLPPFPESNGTYSYTVTSSTPNFQPVPDHGPVTVDGAPALVSISFLANQYPVYFDETGLPNALSWSVAFNGAAPVSTTNNQLIFNEFNGTYAFVVASADLSYQPTPATGNVKVSGSSSTVAITFHAVLFAVVFSESGLPASQLPWNVSLGGVVHSSSNSTVTFQVTNGSYPWTIGPKSGWQASPSSGSLQVQGAIATITITWAQFLYDAWFNESGLPNGTTWAVTANGVYESHNTSSVLFQFPNGTYNFKVQRLSGYLASTYSGAITLEGGPTVTLVNWTQVTYALNFVESGLPSGTRWNVSLPGYNVSTSTLPIITFTLPNGTYNFTVSSPHGYAPFPPGGSVVVNGGTKTVSLSYSANSYLATFGASGLPVNTSWAVTVDGVRRSSNTSTVEFNEPNGSYTFEVGRVVGFTNAPTGGTFSIAGGPLLRNITFTAVVYTVEFLLNTSLPVTVNWSVSLGNITEVGFGNQAIVFEVRNGSYSLKVEPLLSYLPLSGTFKSCGNSTGTLPVGTVKVCGKGWLISVGFAHVPGWSVTFLESGLRPGVAWSVSSAGEVVFSSSPTLVLQNVSNGTYGFYVGFVPGYAVSSPSGYFEINGHPAQANVSFVKAAGEYIGPPRGFSQLDWAFVGTGVTAVAIIAIGLAIRNRRRGSEPVT